MNSMFLYLILSLIALCHCVNVMYNHTNQENNLYFVFTTFRHGARKPLFGKDFFGNSNYSAGALTTYGRIQHLEIGRNYRKRYSNFVNISFDKNELYIRSTDVGRTIVSTEKELEGFFNKTISRSNIVLVRGGNFMDLFHLDPNEKAEMNKYIASCPKRKLGKNYGDIFNREIFPNVRKCYMMENITNGGMGFFCDSIFSHYLDYFYGNETNNIISRCSNESIQKFYDFCVELHDTYRGWNEIGAYMFYMLFQHIFQYMDNYINGRSKIRMMMIGGHDVTVAPFMDFLNGLNIIPRIHFPYYACNIVMELRKYGQDFYLEFYYNDVLKYNNTLEKFKSILDNSKYSNLYNYCGIPSYLNNTINNFTNQTVKNETKIENVKNETNNTINNQTIENEIKNLNIKNETIYIINNQTVKNETKFENIKNETNNTINNQTVKNETKLENIKNETNNTINNQTLKNETIIENIKNEDNSTVNSQAKESNSNATQKENRSIQNSTKEKEDIKVETLENNPNKNLLNNNDTLVKKNETSLENQRKNFIQKTFNDLYQQDMNFYIIVICASVVIVTLIAFAIFVFIWRKNRKKRYIKFKEAVEQKVNSNNLSIMTLNAKEVKSEPQSKA